MRKTLVNYIATQRWSKIPVVHKDSMACPRPGICLILSNRGGGILKLSPSWTARRTRHIALDSHQEIAMVYWPPLEGSFPGYVCGPGILQIILVVPDSIDATLL
jgi:hypothetical protein